MSRQMPEHIDYATASSDPSDAAAFCLCDDRCYCRDRGGFSKGDQIGVSRGKGLKK